jgi:ribosomal protein S18 acetylase RimI-like enzyme
MWCGEADGVPISTEADARVSRHATSRAPRRGPWYPVTTMGALNIRGIEKPDFDYLVSVLDRWWGGPAGQRAHPYFFYELGEYALIAEDDGRVVGFLLGLITPRKDSGYVHLVGIDPDFRRRGVGQRLYERFEERCRSEGVPRLKAIAAVGNDASVAFHEALGFTSEEVAHYAGPGRARMVFTKSL